MAIEFDYTLPGTSQIISSTYAAITTVIYSSKTKRTDIKMDVYKNKADSDAGKLPFTRDRDIQFKVPETDYDTYFDTRELEKLNQNVVERSYAWIKTLDSGSSGNPTGIDFRTVRDV